MAMDADNRPWIRLAGALGKLVRQLVGDSASQNASISVVTRGKMIVSCPGSISNQNFRLDQNLITLTSRLLKLCAIAWVTGGIGLQQSPNVY